MFVQPFFCFEELHFNVELNRNSVTGRKGKFGIQQSHLCLVGFLWGGRTVLSSLQISTFPNQNSISLCRAERSLCMVTKLANKGLAICLSIQ